MCAVRMAVLAARRQLWLTSISRKSMDGLCASFRPHTKIAVDGNFLARSQLFYVALGRSPSLDKPSLASEIPRNLSRKGWVGRALEICSAAPTVGRRSNNDGS